MKNRMRDMETWNRLIAVGGEEEGGNGRRKGKGLIKEHTCMIHEYGQQCGDWLWKWGQAGWRGFRRGKNRTSVIA